MISPNVLSTLVSKGFVMAGATPTWQELCDALAPSEWSCTRNVVVPVDYRGWCRHTSANTETSHVMSDPYMDNLMARLWIKLH